MEKKYIYLYIFQFLLIVTYIAINFKKDLKYINL